MLLNALLITLISVGLSRVVIYELTSIDSLAPASKVSDWLLTDIYNSIAADRQKVPGDPDIVIIDIDTASRSTIAALIEAVNFCEPKAVGLDVIFKYPSDDGLYEAIQNCDNIVLPLVLEYDEQTSSLVRQTDSFFYDRLEDKAFGAVNFNAEDVYDVVREFSPFFDVGDEFVENFSTALVRLASPERYEELIARANESEIIYFPSEKYNPLVVSDVIDESGLCRVEIMNELNGKIVFIGDMNNRNDMFLTPLGGSVPGVEIHARTLATILYGRYIAHSSVVLDWVIALLCCFLLALAGQLRGLSADFNDILSFLVRILQVSILYAFVFFGVRRFIEHNQYMDFSASVMMVGLCALATDVYKGLVEMFRFIFFNLKTYKRKK